MGVAQRNIALATAVRIRGIKGMIKIYFGPYKHSPAQPLGLNEATLWLDDFGLLRGYDRDFWTNNPLHLDMFPPDQIQVWQDRWLPLPEALAAVTTSDLDRERIKQLPPGRQALCGELLWLLKKSEGRTVAPEAD